MRPTLSTAALAGVLVLALAGCAGDADTQIPVAVATPSAMPDGPSLEPTDDASDEPDPAPSPTPEPSPTPTIAAGGPFTEEGALAAARARREDRGGECESGEFTDDLDQVVSRRDDRMLVHVICFLGAYQSNGELLMYDGLLLSQPMEQWMDGGIIDSFEVVGDVDETTPGRLTNLHMYRGLGDCGLLQTWTWDGDRITLVEAREQECTDDGSAPPPTEWPVVYRR